MLHLKWERKHEEDGEDEFVNNCNMVLEGLKPHPNLNMLSIQGFGGLKLPEWLGSSYCLPNLVTLCFDGCKSCEKLPGLGMLPFLRVLKLVRMRLVKRLGEEFYYQGEQGESSSPVEATTKLFPSLIELKILMMSDLEEWVAPPPLYGSFPVLEDVGIKFCKKLKSVPDLQLCSSLRKVDILICDKLKEYSIPGHFKNLPALNN